jgi:hypothetical protein
MAKNLMGFRFMQIISGGRPSVDLIHQDDSNLDMKIDSSLTSLKQMRNRNNPRYPSVKMLF